MPTALWLENLRHTLLPDGKRSHPQQLSKEKAPRTQPLIPRQTLEGVIAHAFPRPQLQSPSPLGGVVDAWFPNLPFSTPPRLRRPEQRRLVAISTPPPPLKQPVKDSIPDEFLTTRWDVEMQRTIALPTYQRLLHLPVKIVPIRTTLNLPTQDQTTQPIPIVSYLRRP